MFPGSAEFNIKSCGGECWYTARLGRREFDDIFFICQYLSIFVNICQYLSIFVNIYCQYLYICVNIYCQYLSIFVNIYEKLCVSSEGVNQADGQARRQGKVTIHGLGLPGLPGKWIKQKDKNTKRQKEEKTKRHASRAGQAT